MFIKVINKFIRFKERKISKKRNFNVIEFCCEDIKNMFRKSKEWKFVSNTDEKYSLDLIDLGFIIFRFCPFCSEPIIIQDDIHNHKLVDIDYKYCVYIRSFETDFVYKFYREFLTATEAFKEINRLPRVYDVKITEVCTKDIFIKDHEKLGAIK